MTQQQEKTTTTTTSDLKQLMTKPDLPDVPMSFFSSHGFALAQRVANLFASSTLVPKQYQANIPNCLIALNMANRIGADPLMVMQNLYIVHGRPGWSSQFLIATFNQSGRFSALRFAFSGEKDTDAYGCTAWSLEKATGERLEGSKITIAMAKAEKWYDKDGSKWKTMPMQMLMYRAASWFIRAYAPEIAMGLQTAEELQDSIIEVVPNGTGIYEISTKEIKNEDDNNDNREIQTGKQTDSATNNYKDGDPKRCAQTGKLVPAYCKTCNLRLACDDDRNPARDALRPKDAGKPCPEGEPRQGQIIAKSECEHIKCPQIENCPNWT